MVREQNPGTVVEVAFREMHAPNIQLGIDRCVDQGAKRILLYPYFLVITSYSIHYTKLYDQPVSEQKLAEIQARIDSQCKPRGS